MSARSLEWYWGLREEIIRRGYIHEIDWAQNVKVVPDPETFWSEFSWVVLNSGMKNQIAEKIWEKVFPVVKSGFSASTVFGHKGKSAAIDHVWQNRKELFDEFVKLQTDAGRLSFLEKLPWIGQITKFHLAKNYGMNIAKPDRHLVRIAGTEGTQALCERLAKECGDRVATVDLVIWRAANLGIV